VVAHFYFQRIFAMPSKKGALVRSKNTSGGKMLAAVQLGRLGGKKGGKARSAALSPSRRSSIASMGGKARSRALSSGQKREIAEQARKARKK
jgi:hypothetical protein